MLNIGFHLFNYDGETLFEIKIRYEFHNEEEEVIWNEWTEKNQKSGVKWIWKIQIVK